jgi:putative membrane protein
MKPVSTMFGALVISLAAAQAMAEVASDDKAFATKAAVGGQAEILLGQLAAQNASAAPVKQFGQQMVTDHTQANQELMQIAKQMNLTLPTRPESADRATERQLSNLKGKDFDTAYMQQMVEDHEQDVADFRKEVETGQHPASRAFAAKCLPVLERHLEMARAAERE